MKKLFTSCFIITSLALSPALKAEDLDDLDEGTPVGQASNEGSRAAKRKRWQNYTIAAAAVVVAVTALILVANNDGRKSD